MSTQMTNSILVENVMLGLERVPIIEESVIFKEALEKMGTNRLGIACITSEDGKLLGILTDGDIRRMLLSVQKPFSALFVDDALDHAIVSPITIGPTDELNDAIGLMENKQIWDLPVVDENDILLGLLHLHHAIKILIEDN